MAELVIYAPNVHQGGGKTLLIPILQELSGRDDVLFILDERMDISVLHKPETIRRVKPTAWARLKNEYAIRGMVKKAKRVLCMGNLPPLLAKNDNITVFVQNRYLVDEGIRNRLPLKVRFRLWLERLWLRLCCDRVNRFIVQTASMAGLITKTCNTSADIIPFIPEKMTAEETDTGRMKKYDFLYVASGEEHKNHKNLVKAWVGLAREGQYPRLCLTVSRQRFPALCAWIEGVKVRHVLDIINAGELAHDKISELYRLSRALIYPSLFESFGLPILEAVAHGVPVLAADKDYTYDLLVDPSTFDATSPQSITKAVINFDYVKSTLAIEPCTAHQFLEQTVLS